MTITFSGLGRMGRLGNQLFQIASTIGIAIKNGHDFVFPHWEYQEHFLNTLPTGNLVAPTIKENGFNYYNYILPKGNWDLHGYFQTWKYFQHCNPVVLHYFDFDKPSLDGVAIHIRRGDYVGKEDYHGIPPLSYYLSAMDELGEEYFTIFSDDIDWCKENIKGRDVIFFPTGPAFHDFKIMTGFRKFIISNSSYSWWAAFLSGSKNVIAPSKWFGPNGPKDYEDIYLPEWIRM